MKYLISGGGTGGHIFPAVSIANALKLLDEQAEILFVGALGRMEMERVPQAGYKIIGLPVQGLNRQQPWKNLRVVWNFVRSMRMARGIIRDFKPDVAVGVGGYASAAAMKQAARMGVPVLLQEQNGFAGVTNKFLKNDAKLICVAYEGMERFFPKEKIVLTGNPVRRDLLTATREQAVEYFRKEFGFDLSGASLSTPQDASAPRKTVLVIGGSLGARTINEAIQSALNPSNSSLNLIWQTGKNYYDNIISSLSQADKRIELFRGSVPPAHGARGGGAPFGTAAFEGQTFALITPFLGRMDLAYAAADIVISRAGASSISELCLLGKPAILVPSPNVAEDHQTHNAMALVNKDAAILVKDADARETLMPTLLNLASDERRCEELSRNILKLAKPDAATDIAKLVIDLAKNRA